jgi:demethylmenaquinone methyltransferase / 2-methoxy-6-polyprenyl-1,4-benzoquinol methylase
LHNAFDRFVTGATGLTFTIISQKPLLKLAACAIDRCIILERRPTCQNSFVKNIADVTHEIVKPCILRILLDQRSSFAFGRKPRAVKRLAHINVAKPCNNPLVEQGRLQRSCLAAKPRGQIICGQFIAQRFHPKIAQQLVVRTAEIHHAEPSRIVVDDAGAVIEMEHHMIMQAFTAGLEIHLSQIGNVPIRAHHGEPSRHAEMQDQQLTRFHMAQNVLGAPRQRINALALKSCYKISGKWKPQVFPAQLNADNTPSHQGRLKATFNGFDFGQFGHDSYSLTIFAGNGTGNQSALHKGWDSLDKMMPTSNETVFGFRDVKPGEKQPLVNEVFSKAAAKYDQMNDLMSAGLHRLWKDDFVTQLSPPKSDVPFHVLDVAGGTGDIAFRIVEAGGAGTQVTIADISPEMVSEGKKRGETENRGRVTFTVGNAEELAFPDSSFNAYTIAFGIRNVPDIPKALKEAYRVLKPGGRFMCLEFSHMDLPLAQQMYDAYSFTVIPAVGKVVTGDGQPYRYLVESIRTFPKQQAFADMIEAAGFSRVTWRNLTGGVVAIHSGWRI